MYKAYFSTHKFDLNMPPQYKQKFRLAWLKSDKFKDWLLPIDDDPTRATCKWCKCTITAKLTDIDNHSKSRKHIRASALFTSSFCQKKIDFPKRNKKTSVAKSR
ncbi:uncharacterized protein LOC112588559 [Harpegnathos saltator]|uniref:uncharacterized protein LOC112588559 n=1 Tax=Harpegnathos saltator TaxID=610380 RepID=UPI000DBED388|nr:uncharacterized protein LOC112588559 [Harpegnathos saltator]